VLALLLHHNAQTAPDRPWLIGVAGRRGTLAKPFEIGVSQTVDNSSHDCNPFSSHLHHFLERRASVKVVAERGSIGWRVGGMCETERVVRHRFV
jgi:hypothetical protein